MSNSGTGAHILVFPYPAQGHMIPLLDLSHQLAIRGLTITILITPKNLPLLKTLLSQNPSIQTLTLPFPHHPSIPPGVENVKDLPGNSFLAMMHALGELYHPILHWFKSHPSPPVAILSDFFLGWTHRLASELGIPRLVFSPSAAAYLAIMNCLWRDLPKRIDPNDQNFPVSFPNVPNSPIYPWWHLSNIYRSYVEGDPDSEFIRDGYLCNIASWGVVLNSFSELESVYLDHLKNDLGHDRVWAVGPLLPSEDDLSGQIGRGGSTSAGARDVMSWLDTCEDRSVVYACFGSQAVLTNEQLEGLAAGLDQSGVRFVWGVKEATMGHVAGKYGMIPVGFEDRVAGRGLVIKGWVPQVLILKHRAVGTFLTHCGWNSVLESLIAGVPMLAWPRNADQFVNARLLVEETKLAVRVCEGATTVPDSEKLARAMGEMICEDGSKKVRAIEMQKAAVDGNKEGGNSFKNLDGFVRALSTLALKETK